jgi:Fe-S cluster biogenesis protein NfuA
MLEAEGDDVRQAARRLEELIAALGSHPDPAAGEPARELVALVLDLHALGLARLMAVVASAPGGETLMARLVQDDHVRALLLLHGLHPDDMETRVRHAVERLHPHLGVHGLRLEVAEVRSGTVRLRLAGVEDAKPSLLWTLPAEIESAILEVAPDAEQVLIEGLEFTPRATRRAAE